MDQSFVTLSLEAARRIDGQCDHFEAEWLAGRQPQIEAFLEAAADSERSLLLQALLSIEIELREAQGPAVSLEEHLARFPTYEQVVQQAWGDRKRPRSRLCDTGAPESTDHEKSADSANGDQLQKIVADFEGIWEGAGRPDIAEFLPAEQPLRMAVLRELVRVDADFRRRRGEQPAPGEYTMRFPELIDDAPTTSVDWPLADLPGYSKSSSDSTCAGDTHSQTDGEAAGVTDSVLAQDQQQIPRYRIMRLLGKGAFGCVYLAHDEQLDRAVAVKVPYLKLGVATQQAETICREAQAVARLDHAHIVPVYDAGPTPDGRFFVVSKYVAGSNLATRLTIDHFSPAQAAELVAAIAEALHHAHRQGIVHRDVKPSNILIDESGTPFLVDFGLALREADADTDLGFAGTPAYASPEQARGEAHLLDGRSDVFSLGIVLYELLTGQRPFRSTSAARVLDLIQHLDPKPPRQFDEKIPEELQRICYKALAKRAADRYSVAVDMAHDLHHWLEAATVSTQFMPTLAPPPSGQPPVAPAAPATPRVIPRGLRSFEAKDADFFLKLLPGPYDRDGVPEFIRFWKSRIEDADADRTFRVGLVYGPSGSGKSSAIKAGLLPLLPSSIRVVFVEAAAGQTEERLLKALRKQVPESHETASLTQILSAVRRGRAVPADSKLLIVIDQFEQWLHGRRDYAGCELVPALRQCDGGRVQSLLLVRDDFWMPVMRCMRELDVAVAHRQNSLSVDLFDRVHARRVLTEFGRAYGRLPESAGEMSAEQQKFLEQSLDGLAQDGLVIPVRLSVFAEMCKSRAWEPATLVEVGGADGIGARFLEETFSSAHAPPEHRAHQQAVRAVLEQLLPTSGGELKGSWRTREELLQASGYVNRPADFEELLRILDGELRLLTPVEAGDEEPSSIEAGAHNGEQQFYQLTHDFLVPALRDWLNRKRRETLRGRAQLLLEARSREWNRMQQTRFLPSLGESLRITAFTPRRERTAEQRRMLRAAWLFQTRRALLTVAIVGCAAIAVDHLLQKPADPSSLARISALVRFGDRKLSASERLNASAELDYADPNVRQGVVELLSEESSAAVYTDALERLEKNVNDNQRAQLLGSIKAKIESPATLDDCRIVAFERIQRLADVPQVLDALRGVNAQPNKPHSARWNSGVERFVAAIPLDRLDDPLRRQTIGAMLEILKDDRSTPLTKQCQVRLDQVPPGQLWNWLFDYGQNGGVLLYPDDTLGPYLKFHADDDRGRVLSMALEIQRQFLELYRSMSEISDIDGYRGQYLLESLGLATRVLSHQDAARGRFDESAKAVIEVVAAFSQRGEQNMVLVPAVQAVAPLLSLSTDRQTVRLEMIVRDLKTIPDTWSDDRELRMAAVASLTEIALWLQSHPAVEPGDSTNQELEGYLVALLERTNPRDWLLAHQVLPSIGKIVEPKHVQAIFPWLIRPEWNLEAIGAVQDYLLWTVQSQVPDEATKARVARLVEEFLAWRSKFTGGTESNLLTDPDQALVGVTSFRTNVQASEQVDRLIKEALIETLRTQQDPNLRVQAAELLAGHSSGASD